MCTIEIQGDNSSQFVSVLLMVCPLLICKKIGYITVEITSPLISYPYINITYIYTKTIMRLPL
jgi:5-enolpyruvylshikimate-3-phosphate synthase